MSYNDKKNLGYNNEKRRKINAIKSNELNKECFDCGACYPQYISINNGIFICKDCLKIHNNFPKQISNTLKNNLSSLNNKELEFMFIGGNQKLLNFINYEYPQLQRYKISILYQTKAMQYYRNNLNYLVNGGIKPIKPSELINAYELINIKEAETKKENINTIKKINNNTYKTTKRNKSETILETVNKKIREKNKTYKSKQKKIQNSLLDDDEDTLKRYKSFYKEMNKIFGTNIDIINEEQKNNKDIGIIINKEPKIISNNYKQKNNFSNNNENIIPNSNIDNNKNSSNNSISKKINNKENPIGHIYNNNFITFSATKNIFMFTPNKESIIYKHRKKNNDNQSNNKNNKNIPTLNTVKEIYSKPKIPYLITSNKKREDNSNLYFSLQENNFKHDNLNLSEQNEHEIKLNGDKYIKNNNDISQEYKHTTKNIKNENKEMSEDINPNINLNIDISKDSFEDNQNNKDVHENKNILDNNNAREKEKGSNSIFAKKRICKLMKKDRQTLENENKLILKDNQIDKKGNTFILFRKEKEEKFLDKNDKNNKTELKENEVDEIKKIINKDTHNEIDVEDNKNKTFTEIKESGNKRRTNINLNNNSNLTEKDAKKNPIMIKEREEAASLTKKDEILEEKNSRVRYNKRNDKKDIDKQVELKSKKMEEKTENKNYNDNENNDKKLFADKRRKRYDKHLGLKENIKDEGREKKIEEGKNRRNKDEMKENEKGVKKVEKDSYKMKKVEKIKTIQDNNYSPFHRQKNELTKTSIGREVKDIKINNSENLYSVIGKNIDVSKTTNENNENNGTNKFSIRNKYKMRKMKELV